MNRTHLSFADFKRNWIDQPWGYYPVWVAIAEDGDGDPIRGVVLDLICEWRLSDGKVCFIEVEFQTEEELRQIKEWVAAGASALRDATNDRIKKLSST